MLIYFRNDAIIAETTRIVFEEDAEGRSFMKLKPALGFDVGMYKCVARNRIGQTVAHTRVVQGTSPDPPNAPEISQISDTEMLLTWHPPKYDGFSQIICYSLEYKNVDDDSWTTAAKNIDHEFYSIRDLEPTKSYMFRLASKNALGWSEQGNHTPAVTTKEAGINLFYLYIFSCNIIFFDNQSSACFLQILSFIFIKIGAAKISLSRTMQHLQQITDSGQEIVPEIAAKPEYEKEIETTEWIADVEVQDRYKFISEIHKYVLQHNQNILFYLT